MNLKKKALFILIMNLVFIGSSMLGQFKLEENYHLLLNNNHTIHRIIVKGGSTIRGLNNPSSTTAINSEIRKIEDMANKTFVFHLGQVDIEIGYYYKSVIAGYKLNKEEYINEIINKYETFIQSIEGKKIIVGVNPTVIIDNKLIFNLNFNNNNNHLLLSEEIGYYIDNLQFEHFSYIYNDSEDDLNTFLKMLNDNLEKMCKKHNLFFCDMWPFLSTSTNRIKDKYRPIGLDNHLVCSTEVGEHLIKMLINNRINFYK